LRALSAHLVFGILAFYREIPEQALETSPHASDEVAWSFRGLFILARSRRTI